MLSNKFCVGFYTHDAFRQKVVFSRRGYGQLISILAPVKVEITPNAE